jgi:hypothetical protein
MTLPKITAARSPAGSPGVVGPQLLAAPGSFEDRCRLDRFCRAFIALMTIPALYLWVSL